MGWGAATHKFMLNRVQETHGFHKFAAAAKLILATVGVSATVFDDIADFIPGLDVITVGDNLVWLIFGGYAIVRISRIRWEANHRPTMLRR
jgi:hypothetical protein